MPQASRSPRRICFVTGTRAEYGLMRTTLDAIRAHPRLRLQFVVTGMHLDPRHGRSIEQIRRDGHRIDTVVPWPAANTPSAVAAQTGRAIAAIAGALERLDPHVVLVVGDRVEAFAAAAAAHVSGRAVAHVHGGDRAMGQVDDALRHAITKLAHLHFPATHASAARVRRLGEDAWRIHRVGSPGIDVIRSSAAPSRDVERAFPLLRPRRYALLVLHPTDPNPRAEARRASMLLRAASRVPFQQIVVVDPNNDPGAEGIRHCWSRGERAGRIIRRPDLPRPLFLGLLRDAAVLAGNSSSGIIEAASFGTPVLDVGPRQLGRERSGNVVSVPFEESRITRVLRSVWNGGRPRRSRARNVYGGGGTGARITSALANVSLDARLLRKLIAY